MYIENKFNFLVQQCIKIYLLIDEIHLKPYIDYQGCNIDGLSDNSNEAATSAFAFMLSCVFSQKKNVGHVMATKCIKVENLFDIVKFIIID